MSAIVSSDEPVTLIGGSDPGENDIATALGLAPRLVAADGGGDHALAAGRRPEAVIGDMDSLSEAGRKALADVLHPVPEQDTTDFDKALRHIAAPLVVAVGFTGGRFDHELAVMSVLVRQAARACLVLGAENIVFLCPPELRLDLPVGSDLSLFPMGEVGIASEGLEWPTGGLRFSPDGRIGTSNRVAGPVTLRPDAPKMLVILPRSALAAAVTAVLAQAASPERRWPALAR